MRHLLMLVAVAVLAAGCQMFGPGDDPLPVDDVRLVSDPVSRARDRGNDGVDIDTAYIRGDHLVLGVRYGGGCVEPHEFVLFAGKDGLMESMPPRAVLALAHDARGDECLALVGDSLRFDLTAFERHYRDQASGEVILEVFAPPYSPSLSGKRGYAVSYFL